MRPYDRAVSGPAPARPIGPDRRPAAALRPDSRPHRIRGENPGPTAPLVVRPDRAKLETFAGTEIRLRPGPTRRTGSATVDPPGGGPTRGSPLQSRTSAPTEQETKTPELPAKPPAGTLVRPMGMSCFRRPGPVWAECISLIQPHTPQRSVEVRFQVMLPGRSTVNVDSRSVSLQFPKLG